MEKIIVGRLLIGLLVSFGGIAGGGGIDVEFLWATVVVVLFVAAAAAAAASMFFGLLCTVSASTFFLGRRTSPQQLGLPGC